MKILIAAFGSGLVFGLGLLLSGMTDPAKVLGFLDLAGAFDPQLAYVMGGAIPVAWIAFRLAAKRRNSVLGGPISLPTATGIDTPLALGALAFGTGWGLAGFCPGPALVSIATGSRPALVFSAAMIAGMVLFELLQRATKPRTEQSAPGSAAGLK